MDTVKTAAGTTSPRGAHPLFVLGTVLPLLLLLGGAVLWRGLPFGGDKSNGSLLAPASAQAFAPGELSALSKAHWQADQTEAYAAAQKLVRQFLLSHTESGFARFPAHPTSPSVSVEKRGPALFRVRAVVQWRRPNGASSVSRRFEADLRHGPTDMQWHMVDTEFLPDAFPIGP